MEKFNQNLTQFIDIIKKNYPSQKELIEKHYTFDKNTGDKYIKEFLNSCTKIGDDISTKNEIIFSKGSTVLVNIDFYSIWNDESLSEEQKNNIWKYLQTLYIFAFEYIKDQDFKTILKQIKKLGTNTSDLDAETKTFMNIIDSLSEKYTKKKDENENEDENEDTSGPNFVPPELFNGAIGDLAKEIAEEIDPSKIDLDDPSKLLKDLLSGNFDENNDNSGLVDLVKNITNKIQDKLSSGKLDESKLFNEAQNVMNTFAKSSKKSTKPVNIFEAMMKSGMMNNFNMDAENQDLFNQASSIIKNNNVTNITPQNIQSKANLKNTRDRLRKKLENKRKNLENKKKQLKLNDKKKLEINMNEDIDLDKLAEEIEGVSSKKK
jgi:hypothetical protein